MVMESLFVDAKWENEIVLGKELLEHIKGAKTVALFASVQFLELDKVKEQLEGLGITVKTTRAKRTHVVGQVLGCDAYHDSFENDVIKEADLILYIGDGMFHPLALLHAQRTQEKIKEVNFFLRKLSENTDKIPDAYYYYSAFINSSFSVMDHLMHDYAQKYNFKITEDVKSLKKEFEKESRS